MAESEGWFDKGSKTEPPDFMEDIQKFHEQFKLDYQGPPRSLSGELQTFRISFMYEELLEYKEAVDALTGLSFSTSPRTPDLVREQAEKALDSLVDLVYVALGTAHLHGFDFNEAWRRVQKANMAKVRAQKAEESTRGSEFDVVKPPGWLPPSHYDLVYEFKNV